MERSRWWKALFSISVYCVRLSRVMIRSYRHHSKRWLLPRKYSSQFRGCPRPASSSGTLWNQSYLIHILISWNRRRWSTSLTCLWASPLLPYRCSICDRFLRIFHSILCCRLLLRIRTSVADNSTQYSTHVGRPHTLHVSQGMMFEAGVVKSQSEDMEEGSGMEELRHSTDIADHGQIEVVARVWLSCGATHLLVSMCSFYASPKFLVDGNDEGLYLKTFVIIALTAANLRLQIVSASVYHTSE